MAASEGSRQEKDEQIRELAKRVKHDPRAEEDLATLVRDEAKRHLTRLLTGRLVQAIDDACQEVWLSIANRIEDFCDPDCIQSPSAWLRVVATHEAWSQSRQERLMSGLNTLDAVDVPDPGTLDVNLEQQVVVREALESLDLKQQRIVTMKMAGCTVQDMINEIGISEEQYVRLLRGIREQLARLFPDETSIRRIRQGLSTEHQQENEQ